jgi:hypothetical protein
MQVLTESTTQQQNQLVEQARNGNITGLMEYLYTRLYPYAKRLSSNINTAMMACTWTLKTSPRKGLNGHYCLCAKLWQGITR